MSVDFSFTAFCHRMLFQGAYNSGTDTYRGWGLYLRFLPSTFPRSGCSLLPSEAGAFHQPRTPSAASPP